MASTNSPQVLGSLVNDSNGINLFSQGDLAAHANSFGFFTSILSKAQALATKNEDKDAPIVRLETSTRTILISKIGQENDESKTIAVSKSLELNPESTNTNSSSNTTTTNESQYP